MDQLVKFEKESTDSLRKALRKYQPKSILFLTGKESYSKSGAKHLLEPLLHSYQTYHYFDFEENPKIEDVEKVIEYFKENHCDLILAVGGGTVLDMAKIVNFFAEKEKPYKYKLQDTLPKNQKVPIIAVPTTAGSGSEATHFAVLYSEGKKYSISDSNLKPEYVILFPRLTYDNPKYLTATTGFDAFSQALESYWCVNSTKRSRKMSMIAMRIIWKHLPLVINDNSQDSRDKIMWASYLAGKCIDITQTTGPHAISYAFTSMFNIPHGHAVSLTIPYFLSFNMQIKDEDCNDVRGPEFVREQLFRLIRTQGCESHENAKMLLEKFIDSIGLERSLIKLGINKSDLDKILSGINSIRAKNNPRRIDLNDLKRFFLIMYD